MLLLIVTLDEKGQYRPFSCQVPQLEAAFEVISTIAATGDVLVSIDLLDAGQHMFLPVEAFDGEPIRPHIERLKEEWSALLNEPVSLQSVRHRMLATFSQQLQDTYQTRIDWLELAISQTESSIQQLPREATYWESCYVRLEIQLSLYRRQLDQAQTGLQGFCQRWATYIAC